MLERPESNDLLEEVEHGVARGGVREVGDRSGARPRDDRGDENTNKDSSLDAVEHQEHGEDSARGPLS